MEITSCTHNCVKRVNEIMSLTGKAHGGCSGMLNAASMTS